MATNLTKRLDRLERLLRERTAASTSPLYLRDGDAIPDGVDAERIIIVVRTYVDPPAREDEELPVPTQEAAPAVERPAQRQRLAYPDLGL